MTTVPFSCSCKTVKGTVANATPRAGNHLACFCASCRAGALYCGADDPLADGVQLFQTTADQITITDGIDRVIPFSFGPRNLLRWKADCCGVQICSSPRNPGISFVGMITDRLDNHDTIGPVNSRAFVPQKDGTTKNENFGGFLRVLAFTILKRFTGGWRNTPLFDAETKQPIAPVILVSRAEKTALLKNG